MAYRSRIGPKRSAGCLPLSRSAVIAVVVAGLPLAANAEAPPIDKAPLESPASGVAGEPTVKLAQAGPVSPDERFWSTIQNSTLPDLFEMFIKRYPESPRRPEAEARLAALKSGQNAASAQEQADSMLRKEAATETSPLTTGSTPPPTRSATPAQPVTEARAPATFPTRTEIMVIQAELLRVGCLGDTVDGIWGPKTQAAASLFVSTTGLEGQMARPGLAILDALRKSPGRVCTQTASVPASATRPQPDSGTQARTPTRKSKPSTAQRTTSQTSAPAQENWAKGFLDSLVTSTGGGSGGGGGGGGGGW
jgi:hypothetical protein